MNYILLIIQFFRLLEEHKYDLRDALVHFADLFKCDKLPQEMFK